MNKTPQEQALAAITAVLALLKQNPNAAFAIPGSDPNDEISATIGLIAKIANLAD